MKKLLCAILVLAIILISGCAIEEANIQQDYDFDTNEKVPLVESSNENTVLGESKNFCYNLENNNWRNSCLAFVENNSDNCIYFDSLGFNYYSAENCYWDFGIYINDSHCDKVSGSRKYFCKAIANKDYSYCNFMDSVDSEFSCLNYVLSLTQNEEICDHIELKEDELIEQGFIQNGPLQYDGKAYTGEVEFDKSKEHCLQQIKTIKLGDSVDQYLRNKDKMVSNEIEDCLLLKDVERRVCLIDFALSSNDLSVCNEVNEKRRDDCYDKFGMFLNVSACFKSSNLYEAESCVFSAITSIDRTNQKINPKICDEFKDKNTRNDCYLRYAMMRFRSQ
jgi:hypothetical protein